MDQKWQFDRNKLSELVLRVLQLCEPSEVGTVKLHKVAYFSDMFAYLEIGYPITGSKYVKRPFGPTCEQLWSTIAKLESTGKIEVRKVQHFGYEKRDFLPRAAHDTTVFSGAEAAIIDQVIDFVCRDNTAQSISEISHQAPWELAEFGDEIAIESASLLLPMEFSKESLDWANDLGASVEAARSGSDAVELKDYRDFRSRLQSGHA